jgi:renal tumor antigen|tara:strand:+ start:261 stop:419 length:159 start_codon:yes stop_codon:yes gene_type:complete
VHKIHNVIGTPNKELLDQFQKVASHMEFDFPEKKGTGLQKLVPQYPEACDII